MPKNIVVYSDGTGQDGGVRPEQRVSNVYKLYRATRVSFEAAIDPAEQVAFYDPGLGTDIGATALTAPVRFVQKLLASVIGSGRQFTGEISPTDTSSSSITIRWLSGLSDWI